jgi:hypothetical protein
MDVVLREIWIEAQTAAFTDRTDWGTALQAIAHREEARMLELLDQD